MIIVFKLIAVIAVILIVFAIYKEFADYTRIRHRISLLDGESIMTNAYYRGEIVYSVTTPFAEATPLILKNHRRSAEQAIADARSMRTFGKWQVNKARKIIKESYLKNVRSKG